MNAVCHLNVTVDVARLKPQCLSQLNTCTCLVETCCFTLDQGAGISKVERCTLHGVDAIWCEGLLWNDMRTRRSNFVRWYLRQVYNCRWWYFNGWIFPFIETCVSSGKPATLLTLPRSCCCCCLGIAPRAKMLKISAWLLHPKWWQGSTYRTR